VPYADVTPEDVVARLARGEDVYLLDVREPEEVAEWAYPIGVHIPMGQLGERLDELPKDRTIVVACAAGSRSATVASALSERGWAAENLAGGAIAWAAMEPRQRDGS
jgi:sulfur-carrier protein adenylyltransferase/sulfurtransferase